MCAQGNSLRAHGGAGYTFGASVQLEVSAAGAPFRQREGANSWDGGTHQLLVDHSAPDNRTNLRLRDRGAPRAEAEELAEERLDGRHDLAVARDGVAALEVDAAQLEEGRRGEQRVRARLVHGADALDVEVLRELVEAPLERVAGGHERLDVVDAREVGAERVEEAALLG